MKVCRKPNRDVPQATKIQVLLRKKDISQTELARRAGVTMVTVNQVIWGVKKIPRIRLHIAKELGFESWDELMAHKEVV